MQGNSMLRVGMAALSGSMLLVGPALAQEVTIGASDIGGVVTGADGPEAGVWVIAETFDLGVNRFAKIVVTDDEGRYLLPNLPEGAQYNIWVRGYGLVDSPSVIAEPGTELDLLAETAPDEVAAAQYYPGAYWWAMIDIPDAGLFPGTGPDGNGMPEAMDHQARWMNVMKQNGCGNCHQAGGPAMRTIPEFYRAQAEGSEGAWMARLSAGQGGQNMMNTIGNLTTADGGLLVRLADWTDRIAAGEVPAEAPERPQGIERNLVINIWDWHRPTDYLHDLIGTDKRDPTVNAWGPFSGAPEISGDMIPFLDPANHTAWSLEMPMLDPDSPRSSTVNPVTAPSVNWGMRQLWRTQVNAHTNMMDGEGRTWWTASMRPQWAQPDWCLDGSDHPSAQLYPVERASGPATNTENFVQNARGVTMFDPSSGEWHHVDTCFGTHHLNFGYDENNTLYLGGNNNDVLGWVNTNLFIETGDSAAAQAWTPFILDTNGNGVRDAGYAEPGEEVDSDRDMRIVSGMYGISADPSTPGVIWGSDTTFPSGFVRVDLGDDPPATALTEYYRLPYPDEFGMRGMDVDSTGVAWGAGAGGHLVSFDRSQCAVLNGPTATGDHCPEGFAFYPLPGPKFAGVEGNLATVSSPYYTWVDIHDILGLGQDTVVVLGNQSDGLHALTPDREWVHLAVPYPMGFFTKGLDGRIDDPDGGWSARGLWATWGGRAPWHSEGGKGTPSYVVQIQLRPDPLAN